MWKEEYECIRDLGGLAAFRSNWKREGLVNRGREHNHAADAEAIARI